MKPEREGNFTEREVGRCLTIVGIEPGILNMNLSIYLFTYFIKTSNKHYVF
jgi:hypothetical protein